MKIFFKLVVVLTLLILPSPAFAHGAIFTYKYIDGDNLVMVTHNVHDAQAGAPITYNLRLYTMDGQLVPFRQVQVKVQRDGQTTNEQTVTNAQSESDELNFVYAYPTEGNYLLSLVFMDQNKQVARGEFPIVVTKGLESSLFIDVVRMILAFGLGVAATIFYLDRKGFKVKAHIKGMLQKNPAK